MLYLGTVLGGKHEQQEERSEQWNWFIWTARKSRIH
nr:MAG TPA: hypothetical protein [Caudoviricetes sp.]